MQYAMKETEAGIEFAIWKCENWKCHGFSLFGDV